MDAWAAIGRSAALRGAAMDVRRRSTRGPKSAAHHCNQGVSGQRFARPVPMFVLRSLQQSGEEVSGGSCLVARLSAQGKEAGLCEDGGDASFACVTTTG